MGQLKTKTNGVVVTIGSTSSTTLATVASTGSYSDLTNKPVLLDFLDDSGAAGYQNRYPIYDASGAVQGMLSGYAGTVRMWYGNRDDPDVGTDAPYLEIGPTYTWLSGPASAAWLYLKQNGSVYLWGTNTEAIYMGADASGGSGIDIRATDSGSNWIRVKTTGIQMSAATITLSEAANIAVGTTTGTKIGTATTQKLGFFNATPIVQPAASVANNDVLINLGLQAVKATTDPSLLIKGMASLTGPLIEARISDNTQKFAVSATGAITVPEQSAPATPASGFVVLYAKADGLLYSKDDAGVETVVTGGGGGGVGSYLDLPEGAAPATPAAGYARLYADSNGILYQKTDGGTAYRLVINGNVTPPDANTSIELSLNGVGAGITHDAANVSVDYVSASSSTGLRFMAGSRTYSTAAANFQLYPNGHASFPGQVYFDSGSSGTLNFRIGSTTALQIGNDGASRFAFNIELTEQTAPGTPAANKVAIYAKSDGKVYRKDDTGTEAELGGGGGSVDDTAYNATSWDGVTTAAPSKNAVRDKIDSMDTTIATKADEASAVFASRVFS